jgi:hypothetical protein
LRFLAVRESSMPATKEESSAARHQLAVLKRCRTRRPCFRPIDRLFWVFLSWWGPGWRGALTIIQAATVLRWRRDGITVILKYRSRGRRRGGRPRIAVETRQLIHEMAQANFLWGAPRIHGELLKLGITVSQAIVSRYMPVSHGGQRSQTWRAFVRNQATAIVRYRTFEGRGWIDNIRSWSRVVRHRVATFAATALGGPPSSRTWYLAHTRSLIATHRCVRIARDEALNTVSMYARSFDGRSDQRPHHVAYILNQRHAFVTEATDPLCKFCMGAPQCGAPFSDLPSHV